MGALVPHPVSDIQDEILRRYCTEAERRIMQAHNAQQARQWGEEVCAQLRQECSSTLVLHATRTYVDALIRDLFGKPR